MKTQLADKLQLHPLEWRLNLYDHLAMYYSVVNNDRHKDNGQLQEAVKNCMSSFSCEVMKSFDFNHREFDEIKKLYKEARECNMNYLIDLRIMESLK